MTALERPRLGDTLVGRTLAGRILGAQAVLIAAMAGSMVLVSVLVGPRVFHDHMLEAGSHGAAGSDAVLLHAEEAFTQAGAVALLLGVAIGVAGALLLSVLGARRIGRPLGELAVAAERIAHGRYDVPVPVTHAGAEVDSLAESFRGMADRLAETESTRRRLLTDVAHEMRTPLAALSVLIEGLEDGVLTADETTLAHLRQHTGRLTRLTADLRDVSAAEEGRLALQLEPVDVGAVVAEVAQEMSREYAARGIALRVRAHPVLAVPAAEATAPGVDDTDPAPAPAGRAAAEAARVADVEADPGRLAQIVRNLLTNAARHTPEGGQVDVTVTAGAQEVSVTVADTGDGIAAEHLPHVFERFYRTDAARDRDHGGSGVGLSISRAIARAHAGDLTAASPGPGRGARFTLLLPRR